MSLWKEFKEFALKGNIIDMSIGVIIGGAFGKIVTSLVNDILMPALGILTGGQNLSSLKHVITPQEINSIGEIITEESAILYGSFLQNVLDFFIIAFCIFLILRLVLKFSSKLKATAPVEEEAAAPTSEELLTEIRDLLKTDANSTK
jgi:large conductance mechanosensitive channel protein